MTPSSPPPAGWELLRGRVDAPPPLTPLRAGTLEASLEGVDVRYVRAGGEEVVRRLYVAVRDVDWGTVPGEVLELRLDGDGTRFEARFEVAHRGGDVDFRWRGAIAGTPDALTYEMDGVARSPFAYCRIGLCVLHPPSDAGRPYRAATPAGEISGTLPELIEPQRVEAGRLRPIFPSFTALTLGADFRFEGDEFEMEDQRNWTDASFKTYSTPLALGFPHHAEAGQRIAQRVTVRA